MKGNQTMKFVKLIEIPREIFFFVNYVENEARKLAPDAFCFLKKLYIR